MYTTSLLLPRAPWRRASGVGKLPTALARLGHLVESNRTAPLFREQLDNVVEDCFRTRVAPALAEEAAS